MKKILIRKIRIAVIGCGRISKCHFDAIEKYKDNIELISICDNNQDVLTKHENEYKVK